MHTRVYPIPTEWFISKLMTMNQLIESLTYDKSTSDIFSISALGHAERNLGSANHTYDAVIAHQALRSTDQTGKTRFNI